MRQTKISFDIRYFLFALLLLSSYGQTPAPKVGFIRFWDMLPATSGAFEVRKATGSTGEPAMLMGTAYRYSSYGDYPAGRYRLGVFRHGEDRPLKIFDVDLKPDSYFTILISPQSVEMYDDTIDAKTSTGTVIIRNYFSGTSVAVSSGTQKIVEALQYGQSYAVTGLALSRMPVTLRTRLPNGQAAEAGADVDFKTSKHATLLIIPDSYGRFRARVTVDGKNF